jgi:hypothetical protein
MHTPPGFNGDNADQFDYEQGQLKPLTEAQRAALDEYNVELALLAECQPQQKEIPGETW